jgi:Holliday junction DNA helicase RuvA
LIGGLRGKIARKSPGLVLVDCGGVIYEVTVSLQAFAALPAVGAPVEIDIITHVREDVLQLFGFFDAAEKTVFHWLRSVSGVGPKLAMNILSGMPAAEICAALAEGDALRLVKIPGVGKKVSERLVMELRERAAESNLAAEAGVVGNAAGAGPADEEALSVLVNLGYKKAEAERVLKTVPEGLPLEELLREALRGFAK